MSSGFLSHRSPYQASFQLSNYRESSWTVRPSRGLCPCPLRASGWKCPSNCTSLSVFGKDEFGLYENAPQMSILDEISDMACCALPNQVVSRKGAWHGEEFSFIQFVEDVIPLREPVKLFNGQQSLSRHLVAPSTPLDRPLWMRAYPLSGHGWSEAVPW